MTSRARRNIVYAVIAALLVIIGVNLVARALDDAVGGSEPSGTAGSSYATGPDGLAAYAQLLADYGHPVQRQRGSLADADLDPSATLILTDGGRPSPLEDDEVATIRSFLEGGGRAVLVELRVDDIEAIAGITPVATDGVDDYRRFDSSFDAADSLRIVRTSGERAYELPDELAGDLSILVSEGDRALLVGSESGPAEVLMLGETTPLENRTIGEADNAAFALTLPGTPERPVVFAEGVHGYGGRSGLTALPDRWKLALVVIGLAAVLFAWSRARRLGPADQPTRDLPPPRSVYVDAMANTLAHTSDRARSLAPLVEWARGRVRQRAGLASDASRESVSGAARYLGLTDEEIEMLWRAPADDHEVLVLGRVVARLSDETKSRT